MKVQKNDDGFDDLEIFIPEFIYPLFKFSSALGGKNTRFLRHLMTFEGIFIFECIFRILPRFILFLKVFSDFMHLKGVLK